MATSTGTCGSARRSGDPIPIASRLAASGGEKPEVYLWCGEQDDLKKCSDSTAAHLRALGFKVDYETGEGTHDWKYWDEQIEKVLARLPLEKIGG